jgi:hypothetical protein
MRLSRHATDRDTFGDRVIDRDHDPGRLLRRLWVQQPPPKRGLP